MSFLKNIIVACLVFFGTVISLAQKAKMSEIYEGNVFHIALSYG